CDPAHLNGQARQMLEVMVELSSGVFNPRAASELTSRFAGEAYKELCARSMDDRVFDNERNFMRSLVHGTVALAQEYEQNMTAGRRLGGAGRGEEPGGEYRTR